MKYIFPAITDVEKENNKKFCTLRDSLVKYGVSIHYDTFKGEKHFFSVRHVYLDKKMYVMKRCDKRCIEIVDLMQEYRNAKEIYEK